jgi:hypothetical protein
MVFLPPVGGAVVRFEGSELAAGWLMRWSRSAAMPVLPDKHEDAVHRAYGVEGRSQLLLAGIGTARVRAAIPRSGSPPGRTWLGVPMMTMWSRWPRRWHGGVWARRES